MLTPYWQNRYRFTYDEIQKFYNIEISISIYFIGEFIMEIFYEEKFDV